MRLHRCLPMPAYLQYARLINAYVAKQKAEAEYAALLNKAPITIRARFGKWRKDHGTKST